jgi:hypothetical protein
MITVQRKAFTAEETKGKNIYSEVAKDAKEIL